MNVDIKDAGAARKIATVSFEPEEVSKFESNVCQDLGRMVSIPGFRKGKAPAQVIRKKYAKELHEELNRKVSTSAYEAVLERKDIKVYSVLKVDAGELEPTQAAAVEVTIDIEPEFDLPAYKEYELTVFEIMLYDKSSGRRRDYELFRMPSMLKDKTMYEICNKNVLNENIYNIWVKVIKIEDRVNMCFRFKIC